jgi:hypothetical protein
MTTTPIEDSERTRHEVERLITAAQDALTDDMIGRLTEAIGAGISLIDQVNRSGLDRAIPALAQLVHNGDLERMVQLARLYGSAQDAVTEEMIGRLAETAGNGMVLLDRFSRGGAVHLIEMLEKLQHSGALERIAQILPEIAERLDLVNGVLIDIENAAAQAAKAVPAPGGIGSIWRMMTDPETQQSLRFLLEVGKTLRKSALAGK